MATPSQKEVDLLVRRLAKRGLLEYRLRHPQAEQDQVVIEPKMPDYWPQAPKLGDTTGSCCRASRICGGAAMRWSWSRRGPARCSGFAIRTIAAALAVAVDPAKDRPAPQAARLSGANAARVAAGLPNPLQDDAAKAGSPAVDRRRRKPCDVGFPRPAVPHPQHRRPARQPDRRPLSLCGRHCSAAGTRPRWPGKTHRSPQALGRAGGNDLAGRASLLRERHSTRDFDDGNPITLAELSRFLDGAARMQSKWKSALDLGDGSSRDRLHLAALSRRPAAPTSSSSI